MADTSVSIPADFLRQVLEHVDRTGEPLLRGCGPADHHCIQAWPGSDGDYDLHLLSGSEEDLLYIESWGGMADYLDMPLEELLAEAKRRGYPWVPAPEELEEFEQPGDHPLPEVPAEDLERYMRDHVPGPQIMGLLGDLQFELDPAAHSVEIPPGLADQLNRVNDEIRVDSVAETYERSGTGSTRKVWVPSAVSLSCLQYVLDTLKRHVGIELARVEGEHT